VSRRLVPAAVCCMALIGCGDAARRPATWSQEAVTVRTFVERTAVWVGDPLTYTVEVRCAPGYDIVEDELGRDHLRLDGLEVRDASVSREVRDGGVVVYRARFELVSYAFDQENLRIGGRSVRYYQQRADGSIAGERPAGSVEVLPVDLVLRSVVPGTAGPAIRTPGPTGRVPGVARLLQPVGLTLVVLALAMVGATLAAPLARRWRLARRTGPAPKPVMDYRLALEDLKRVDGAADQGALLQAFDRLDRLMRERLAESGIDARPLTPDEIEARAEPTGDTARPGPVAHVLRECERVRYGGGRHAPSHELLRQVLAQAEAALTPVDGRGR